MCVTVPYLFKDEDITWYTSAPDVTPCFYKSVLTWASCGLLLLIATPMVPYVSRQRYVHPWNYCSWLQLARLVSGPGFGFKPDKVNAFI